MRVQASAPGKLIILGEYAVLEGAPALVTSVQRRASVGIEVSEGDGCWVNAPEIGVSNIKLGHSGDDASKLAFVQECVTDVCSRFPTLKEQKVKIDICSERFLAAAGGPKLGLGSSAAVSAALVMALETVGADGNAPEPAHVFEVAHRSHRRAQGGVGSGLDVAASSFGGLVAMYPGSSVETTRCERLTLPVGLNILPVYTGRGASTTELVGAVQAYAQRERTNYERIIDGMVVCAESAIASQSAAEFTAAFTDYGTWLAELGRVSGADIVSEPHQRLADVATTAGLAYKSSGAGGGDIGLVIGDDPAALDAVRGALIAVGGTPLDLVLGGPGLDFTLG